MSLEHPNVVPIYDAGDVDGRLYLAMRLVEGTDLRALLHAEGALDPARALAICSQVANALDAAHAKGLVHRDVKPSNVLLDASEHVYLADFGLTRRLDEQGGPAGEGRSVGTPAYLAPEQIEGGPVDGRADVYSLGCLLYECLTGETPFARGSRLAVAWAHLEEEPPSASERRPELPEAIDAVIRKAMAKEPEDRYTTCAALITAAEEALGLRRSPPLHRRKALLLVARDPRRRRSPPQRSRPFSPPAGTARRRRPAVRQSGHARPHRSCDEQGQRRHRRRARARPRPRSAGTASGSTTRTARSISEIDAGDEPRPEDDADRRPHPADAAAVFTGPVLAADASGAWFVSGDASDGRSHAHAGAARRRAGSASTALDLTPTGVAVGYGAVWVVGRGARDYQVLRIDPATGRGHGADALPSLLADRRRSPSATAASGSWARPTATLYRIDPRSASRTGRVDARQLARDQARDHASRRRHLGRPDRRGR